MTESTVTLSNQEMETVKLIVAGVKDALKAEIEGLKEVTKNNDTKVCEKINEIKTSFTQHDKRISKLEISLAYQIGKIAGIASITGGLVSIIVLIIQGFLK